MLFRDRRLAGKFDSVQQCYLGVGGWLALVMVPLCHDSRGLVGCGGGGGKGVGEEVRRGDSNPHSCQSAGFSYTYVCGEGRSIS